MRSGENVSAQVWKLSTRASEELSPEIQAWMTAFERWQPASKMAS